MSSYISYSTSSHVIRLAETYFPFDYVAEIRKKHTYEQSLVARYMVSRIVEQNWGVPGFLPLVDTEGKPISE